MIDTNTIIYVTATCIVTQMSFDYKTTLFALFFDSDEQHYDGVGADQFILRIKKYGYAAELIGEVEEVYTLA